MRRLYMLEAAIAYWATTPKPADGGRRRLLHQHNHFPWITIVVGAIFHVLVSSNPAHGRDTPLVEPLSGSVIVNVQATGYNCTGCNSQQVDLKGPPWSAMAKAWFISPGHGIESTVSASGDIEPSAAGNVILNRLDTVTGELDPGICIAPHSTVNSEFLFDLYHRSVVRCTQVASQHIPNHAHVGSMTTAALGRVYPTVDSNGNTPGNIWTLRIPSTELGSYQYVHQQNGVDMDWRYSEVAFADPGPYIASLSSSLGMALGYNCGDGYAPATADVEASLSLEFERCLEITTQPVSASVGRGGTATLTVAATGASVRDAGQINYEWEWNWPCQTGSEWISITSSQTCLHLFNLTLCADGYVPVGGGGGSVCGSGEVLFFSASDQGTPQLVVTLDGMVEALAFRCHVSNVCDEAASEIASVNPGDVDNSGTVNVDDLLAVINSWGKCPAPLCLADIAPSPGDGTVNVDDLLLLINNWG